MAVMFKEDKGTKKERPFKVALSFYMKFRITS